MDDTELVADWAADTDVHVRVCRLNGSEVRARLTMLRFDSCQFESDAKFASDEQVTIHMDRMGWIRARITRVRRRLADAEFSKECLV